jgi:hypothetical protein
MSLREQYKEHEHEIKELLGVPADEPIFILRAQDAFSVDGIRNYQQLAVSRQPIGREGLYEWEQDLGSILNDFLNWQRSHRDKVKVPD